MWLRWWKDGRFKTEERFADLLGQWKTQKAAKREDQARQTLQQIGDLGIPVLPYLIANAEQQPDLLPVIVKLTDAAVPPTATPADCKQWWAANRHSVELPPIASASTQTINKK